MKKYFAAALSLALALTLTACAVSASNGAPEAGSVPETSASQPDASQTEKDHDHQLTEGDNIVPHEEVGYCGNTVTTVSREERVWDAPWEASFWGEDSVALTDLLLYLDYSGNVCRCLPEYSVDTEFDTGYGVNLTEGYARFGGGQADLTEEQVEQIREILERQGETP